MPIITRRATYSQNAIFSKRGVKAEKITPTPSIPLADSYSILDDGYGNEQFYGKAIPLTLQEAAEHYKENVINVESEKFRQFETVAFFTYCRYSITNKNIVIEKVTIKLMNHKSSCT